MTLIPELERDLVAAAEGRRRSVRRRARRVVAVGVAAAAASAVALVTFSSSDESPGPSRATGDHGQPAIPAPPQGTPPPVPGTLVSLSTFDFRGVQYQMSGYRSRGGSRNDSVCVQIHRTPPVAPGLDRPSVMCAGDGLLRRRLGRERVLNVGGGGGPPQRLEVTGFTVAGVSRVRAVGANWPAHVELTRAWRPLNGRRLRAFVIVADPPRDAKLPRNAFKIHGVEAGR